MAGFTLKIGADASAYKNELNKMRTQTKAFSSKIGGLMKGAFAVLSVGALRNISKEFVEMSLAAQTLGVNTKEFQKFAQAANAYGLDVETVADAFKDLGVKITDASLDSKNAYAKNFQEMDFDFMAAAKKDPIEQMYMFADAISKLDAGGARFQMDEINDAMFRMGPLLIRNRKELKGMVDQFKGFSKEELDSLVEGEASWARMVMQLKTFIVPNLQIVAGLVKDIGSIMAGDFKAVMERNRDAENKAIRERVIPQTVLPQKLGQKIGQKIASPSAQLTPGITSTNPALFPLVAIKALQAIEENTKDKPMNNTTGEL